MLWIFNEQHYAISEKGVSEIKDFITATVREVFVINELLVVLLFWFTTKCNIALLVPILLYVIVLPATNVNTTTLDIY